MATEYATIEVFVLVDADGQYVAHEDAAELQPAYADRVGELTEQDGYRTVKLTVKVPLPKLIELTGEVAVDESQTGLAVG